MLAPTEAIQLAIPRTRNAIMRYDNIVCSISGGSDSDIMLDICTNYDTDKKIKYIFINTGIEMKATKEHIKQLEEKYGIEIEKIRPKIPVVVSCKRYGVPFHNKIFSENIYRLQKHNFKWEDKPFEELYAEYPRCKAALRWWCNMWGENSMRNINSAKSDDDVYDTLGNYLDADDFDDLPEDDNECRKIYDELPWKKAIIVDINMPE